MAFSVAQAHGAEYVDKTAAPHGGQIRKAGPYQLELVVGYDELTLYLSDHGDQPIDTASGSAKAIITSGRKRYVVVLSSAGENVLKGNGESKLGRSNVVSVLVALPERDPQRVKFTVTGPASKKKLRSKPKVQRPSGQQP